MKLTERFMSAGEMIELQDSLNKIINPNWRNVGHKDAHTPFMHQTEILEESIELIGSGVQHKWWKKEDLSNFDLFNFKIELIDMLHFYLSQYILVEVDRNKNKLDLSEYGFDNIFFGSDVSDLLNDDLELDDTPLLLENTNELNYEQFVKSVREIVSLDRHALYAEDGVTLSRIFYGLFNYLFVLTRMEGQEISAVFAAKMELNRFRQSDGYKSGNYVKVKDGVEDNQRLEPVIDEFMNDKTKTIGWVRKRVRDLFFKSNV